MRHATPPAAVPSPRRGFTLVELLIVVVILGILASVVIGLVSNTSAQAKRVSAQDTQARVQEAIFLYREYAGQLPDLTGPDWTPLTTVTTVGSVALGPFLQSPPRNPLAVGSQSCLTDGVGTIGFSTCAFLYDYNGGAGSGKFVAAVDP